MYNQYFLLSHCLLKKLKVLSMWEEDSGYIGNLIMFLFYVGANMLRPRNLTRVILVTVSH